MSRLSLNVHQTRDRSGILARTVDAIARQQFADDFRRRRLTLQDSQRIAAIDAAGSIGDWAHRRFAISAHCPTDPISGAKIAQDARTQLDIAHEHVQPPPTQVQPEVARPEQPQLDRSMDPRSAAAPSRALSRIVAVHAKTAAIHSPSDLPHQKKPMLDNGRPDELSKFASERAVTIFSNDAGPLDQSDRPRTQRERAASVAAHFGQHVPTARSFAESLTLEYLDKHTDTRETGQPFFEGAPYDRGRNSLPEFVYITPAAALAQPPPSGDIAIDSERAGFSLVSGRNLRQPGSLKPLANFDQDRGQISNDGSLQAADGNDLANGAIAVAADEIERLRAAIRRSIDELENVRGSVHPPLPAIPPNRGTFRIS